MNLIKYRLSLVVVSALLASRIVCADVSENPESSSVLRKDLDEITTRVLKDKLTWYGDYTGYVDSYFDDDHTLQTTDSNVGVLMHRLRIGLRAEPNQYFKFTGRLAAFRTFDTNVAGTSPEVDPTYETMRPKPGNAFGVERMYIDFYPPAKWISGSFGLIPGSSGRPEHLKGLESIKSTYPNTLFNVNFAGVVLALHPAEAFSFLPESHLWFIASKFGEQGVSSSSGTNIFDPTKFNVKKKSDLFALVGTVSPAVSWSDELTISLAYGTMRNYKIGALDTVTLSKIRGTTLNGFDLDPNQSLGDISRAVFYFEAANLFGSGFTPFFSGAINTMRPGTVKTSVTGTSGFVEGRFGFSGSVFTENRFGKALYTGLNYEFKEKLSGFFGRPILGYEYFMPERNYLAIYTAGTDYLSRLETTGPSHQVYFTQPLGDVSKLHLSYSHIEKNFQNSLFETYVPATGGRVNSIASRSRSLDVIQLEWILGF